MPRKLTDDSELVRNSPLRNAVSSPVDAAVNFIDKRFPWVTPNTISIASTAGKLGLDYLSVKYPKKGFVIGLGQTAVVLGDLLDGALARKKAASNGTKTTLSGALLDASLDKIQEVSHGVALSRRARLQGHKVSGFTHLLSGVTSPLPALARSKAESESIAVKEGGMGTRPIRATCSIVNTALLNNYPFIAGSLSAVTTAQNAATTFWRYSAIGDQDSSYRVGVIEDPQQAADSHTRHHVLGVIAVAAITVATRELYGISRGN